MSHLFTAHSHALQSATYIDNPIHNKASPYSVDLQEQRKERLEKRGTRKNTERQKEHRKARKNGRKSRKAADKKEKYPVDRGTPVERQEHTLNIYRRTEV